MLPSKTLFICREKQRKGASRLQALNMKLTAMNKLLMEENDRLQKQASLPAKDISCESVVTSGLEPTRVAEIVKDRLSWFRECRAVDVMNFFVFLQGIREVKSMQCIQLQM
ncbi:hypothetical protein IGI04_026658 [Brassica rapa subsp. trilocularis]|uniref:Uncharacterized protein n=1 Tax=Brassica rapa subsp. trilocularis TaxID=1813537 RepID=A0ABQ7L0L5_BRACM|nr:hypothetical protein IGI04_026658 [Brassica rapa subsp. trilocularis]